MVFDDKQGVGEGGSRPFMKSIDAGVVQQMFGDDQTLFRSLLARMLRDNAEFALPVAVSWDDAPECRELQGRMHKLKGSAGMIGATGIVRYAGAAERALQEGRSVEIIEGILTKLAAALITLKEEAASVLEEQQRQPGIGDGPATDGLAVGMSDIDELSGLLESQNLAAVDKFAQIAPALKGMLDEADWTRLRDAVENLEFQLGATILRQVSRERLVTAA